MESAAHPLSSTIVGIVGIMDLPDNVIAAAMSMVVSAGGAVKASKTTPLMTINEGLQAMRKGGDTLAGRTPTVLEDPNLAQHIQDSQNAWLCAAVPSWH